MPKRNVVEDILNRFDSFLAAGGKLPETSEGKVNVDGLVQALGCKPSDSQHFFRKDEIKLAVNAVAENQELKPIGFRADQSKEDKEFRSRLIRISKNAKDDAESALEARGTVSLMQREIDDLRNKNINLERELLSIKERMRFSRETGNVFRDKPPIQLDLFGSED